MSYGTNLAEAYRQAGVYTGQISFAGSIARLTRQAGDVAARSRQTRDDASADRIARRREHDRDDGCRLLGCEDWWGVMRENDIDLEPDQFGGDLSEALAASLGPANLDREIATVHPTKFAHPLHKGGDPLTVCQRCARAQVPDGRQLARLLRARRERPRRRRAAECDQQFPPSDGDCHTRLPSEGRKGEDTPPRACCPGGAAPGAGGAARGEPVSRDRRGHARACFQELSALPPKARG